MTDGEKRLADQTAPGFLTGDLTSEALAAAGMLAWRADLRAGRLQWSPGASEVLGLPDIVLNSPELFLRAVHEDDLDLVTAHRDELLASARPVTFRHRLRTRSGTRWFDVAGQGILSETGEVLGATGVLKEVTEEWEADDAVMEALHDAECALEQLGARVWEWDPATDVVRYFIVPEGTFMFAESPRDVSLADILSRAEPQAAARARRTLRRAVQTGERCSFTIGLRDADRTTHRVFVRARIMAKSPRRLSGISINLD